MSRFALSGLLLLVLSACVGGDETISTQATLVKTARDAVVASRAEPQQIVVTRALLDQITTPTLEAVLETRGVTAYLAPFSNRGPVTIWRTADDAQLVIRQGLVTGTRGVGQDLASSDYAQTLGTLAAGQGNSSRRLFLRNALGGQDQLTLRCSIQNLGPAQVEIVERSFATQHLREVCQVDQGQIQNDYWIERRTGVIRQSRQWLGPDLGYLRLRMLKL